MSLAAGVLVAGAALSGCGKADIEAESAPDSGLAEDQVSALWIEREIRLYTLDRMIDEAGSDEVLVNMGGTRESLFDNGVIVTESGEDAVVDWEAGYQDGDLEGFVVELDKDAWNEGAPLAKVDSALNDAMRHNEVTWCGDTVTGEEFVEAYMDEHQEAFDTYDEYTESVIDYVDCGTG
ncbi:hypothetical protein ACFW4K_11975 [Nocardiopsis alba]|uniref:hypothetical protein n=1 Tax=Nocardiopsis alba TaxID=53437 RepID=UPI003671885E